MNARDLLTLDDILAEYQRAQQLARPQVIVNPHTPDDRFYWLTGPVDPTIVVRTTEAADRVEAALDKVLPGTTRKETR